MRLPDRWFSLALLLCSCAGHGSAVPPRALGSTMLASAGGMMPQLGESTPNSFAGAVREAYAEAGEVYQGKNANYIPELAQVDPTLLAIVLMRVDGQTFGAGDIEAPFTMQSIAKVFTLARALEDVGAEAIEKRIGADATGQPLDSTVALALNELQQRHPSGNPLVNAGAIATVGLVTGRDAKERWSRILGTMSAFAGRSLAVDERIYRSQSESNARNQGLAWMLKDDGLLDGDPAQTLDLYTRQCAVAVTARDLAIMGATLASGGVNPRTGARVVDAATAAQVLAVMATAGLYETTGAWMFRVGVPAKSGAAGGVLAIVPGRYAVAAFSPPLDGSGNSVRAQKAIESIVAALGGNIFRARR